MLSFQIINVLSQVLKNNIEEFSNIKTKEGELNVDTYLKKKIIKTINSENVFINDNLNGIIFNRIYDNKEYFDLKNKDESISKITDLVISYTIDGKKLFSEIEVKKTNKDKIPGSSINQINPNKCIIFFKMGKETKVEIGYYSQAVSGRVAFPDRAPRPEVSFKVLEESNKEINETNFSEKLIESQNEKSFLYEGQLSTYLAKQWLNNLFSFKFTTWFHKAISIFSLSLIEKYESMNDKEKESFKNEIRKNNNK